jgi:CRP-like cAMP-binding protein
MSKCEQCIVRQFNSLKHLTKDDLVRISNCKTSKIIKKGESIFEEGDYLNGVYCIKDGVCKVSKMSENGKNQIVNLVKRGDLLGERSLISEEVSNLNAIALEDMEVCFIPREEIIRDLEKILHLRWMF